MGCPKKFSVGNGFGAVLMDQPEKAGAILWAIHNSFLKLQKNKYLPLPFDDNDVFSTSSIKTDANNAENNLANTQIAHRSNASI